MKTSIATGLQDGPRQTENLGFTLKRYVLKPFPLQLVYSTAAVAMAG